MNIETEDNKKLCFAYIDDNTCAALVEKDCKDCNFYKINLLQTDEVTRDLVKKFKKEHVRSDKKWHLARKE